MEEDNLVVPVGRQEPVGSEEPSVEPSLEPLPPTASSPSLPSKPSLAPRAVAPSAPVTPELLVAPAPAPAAGPGETAPEGYSYCFQHSPEGALFAAANVTIIGFGPTEQRQAFLEYALTEGPYRDTLLTAQEAAAPSDVRASIAGFRMLAYDGESARVDVADVEHGVVQLGDAQRGLGGHDAHCATAWTSMSIFTCLPTSTPPASPIPRPRSTCAGCAPTAWGGCASSSRKAA